jgi:hypothetical protein
MTESISQPVPGRLTRILMGIFFPAVIASTVLTLFFMLLGDSDPAPQDDFFKLLILAYMTSGIQSIISSLLTEFVINPKVKNNTLFVVYCTILGTLSGFPFMVPGGFVTGIIMGVLLRWHYLSHANVKNVDDQSGSLH